MRALKGNVKFDLGFQWKLYLSRVGLKEEQLPESQKLEMKRAFYGGCGQILMTFTNDIVDMSDDDGVKALDHLINQTSEFWEKQV